jgi:GT2 family glycosyltransferase
VGGFDEGMSRWGFEDAELSVRLWLAGYRCQVVTASRVVHLFRASFPYKVEGAGIVHNALRLAALHCGEHHTARVVGHYCKRPGFGEAWSMLAAGDALARRRFVATRTTRDFDWFVRHFELEAFA